jgi:hypothetical protein
MNEHAVLRDGGGASAELRFGLCAAAVSEIATRVPAFRYAPDAGAAFGIAVGDDGALGLTRDTA